MLIFGEEFDYRDQIAEVKDCGLYRIGTLPINFAYGACNTFIEANEEHALLCFGADMKNGCHRFSNNEVTAAQSANSEHYETSIGRYQNQAVAVGSRYPSNRKVEKLSTGVWEKIPDFTNQVHWYSMVTFKEDLYLFGGHNPAYQTLAMKFSNSGWRKVGELLRARGGHRSVVIGNSIIHIGGNGGQDGIEVLVNKLKI